MAGWDTRSRRDGTGYGAGVARYSGVAGYCAAVAEVEADTDIRVRRLWLAVDVGRVINPDGVINSVRGRRRAERKLDTTRKSFELYKSPRRAGTATRSSGSPTPRRS